MITSTHALYNLAFLGRKANPERTGPILLGAFFPDLPGVLCLLYCHFIQGFSFEKIHASIYPLPFWQNAADGFHSIPLALGALLICAGLKWSPGLWFCLSALLHSLEDIPVHATNPHRHFWPLSDARFHSPFSCYDPPFHLGLVAALDFSLALWAAFVIARRGAPLWGKALLGLALALETGHSIWALVQG